MKNNLTSFRLANKIRMNRTLHKGAFLIVEGYTDTCVFKGFIDNNCMLIHAEGKDIAVAALEMLDKEFFQGLLVIVDADFWHLEGYKPVSRNLLLTDYHDLETMILSTPGVVEKILAEFGSVSKLAQLAYPTLDMAIANASIIGYFRWISSPSKENLGLNFKNLTFEKFINVSKINLQIDIDELINSINKNSGSIILQSTIKNKIDSLKKENHDLRQVCCGHDIVQILAIGFRFIFGNKKAKEFTPEILEGILRLIYEYAHFRQTALYFSIQNWEMKNPTYKVLKN